MARRILIVGTGDLAHGLCHMFKYNNNSDKDDKEESNYILQVTESCQQKNELEVTAVSGKTFHDTGVPIVVIDDSIHSADIVILAMPSYALKSFIVKNLDELRLDGPIIVDCTNSPTYSKQHDINNTFKVITSLTDSKFRWVKAFNDNGFEQLIYHKVTDKKKLTAKICGPNTDDVAKVQDFAEEALGFETKVVSFEFFDELSTHQNNIGTEWLHAAALLLVIFVFSEIYAIIRYNVKKGYSWSHLPLQVTNKAFCWTAIWGFALCQLPGVVAKFSKRFKKDKLSHLNKYLLWSLGIRKHLGLISLYFLVVHVLMSLLIFNPAYYGKFFLKSNDKTHTKFTEDAEISFFFGILGFSFYLILGLCSLPSIGVSMTSRQWKLMYGQLVWVALVFGFLHVFFMGYKGWTHQGKWPGNMPPITLMSLLVPMFVVCVKIGQVSLFFIMDVIIKLKLLKKTAVLPPTPPLVIDNDGSNDVGSKVDDDLQSWATLDA